MERKEIVDICRELVPEISQAWKYDRSVTFTYDDGRLKVVGGYDRRESTEKINVYFDGEPVLFDRKKFDDTNYNQNANFENHLNSDDMTAARAINFLSNS